MEHELRLILGKLETFASKVKEGLAEADWVTRREIIRTLVKRVEVDQEHVNVIFRVGPQTPSTPSDHHPQSLPHCRGRDCATLRGATSRLLKGSLINSPCFEPRLNGTLHSWIGLELVKY